jgi:hypothetical protein
VTDPLRQSGTGVRRFHSSCMTQRSKVGVLTFHKCINYGSYWQARCLVEGLREQGFDAELIDHKCDSVRRAELRCAFQPMLPAHSSPEHMRGYGRKIRRFIDGFAVLPLSAPVALDRPDGMAEYDIVVIGSDEVWNLAHPWYGGKRLFYGDGVKTQRLVAYAGSFGSYSCHWGLDEYWTDRLRRFDALSVRDENSFWLVRGTTGREPPVVLDPVLQFPQIAESSAGNAEEEPFALVYGHSFPAWLIFALKRWARAAGLRLKSIGYHNSFADEECLDAGPLEFARAMRSARAVVTNYFHGCVFALLNRKPFAIVTSDYRRHKVCDLAAALDLEDRIVQEGTSTRELCGLLAEPPRSPTYARIAGARHQSGKYLSGALA